MTFERFDVVVVPFPFTDMQSEKRRPALVISGSENFNNRVGHSVMAMITSAVHSNWPLDSEIVDLAAAGLPSPSKVRMKLFTLDHRLVIRKIGILASRDRKSVEHSLSRLMR